MLPHCALRVFKGVLQMSRFTLLYLLTVNVHAVAADYESIVLLIVLSVAETACRRQCELATITKLT